MKTVRMFATLLLLVSCSSTPSTPASSDPPVSFAGDVKVAIYDTTPRPHTDKLAILAESPSGKCHIIATLTIDGGERSAENEALLINALAWKARQMGADAIVRLPRLGQRRYGAFGIPRPTDWIFRADAIVFDLEK
jgi:hypothetical protein